METHLFSYLGIIKRGAYLWDSLAFTWERLAGWKKLVGSTVFLKLVRPLVHSDPACADNRVSFYVQTELSSKLPNYHYL